MPSCDDGRQPAVGSHAMMCVMSNRDPADDVRRLIAEMEADPDHRAMMAEVEERHRRLREKYRDVDVATLDDRSWQEWMAGHNVFERDRDRKTVVEGKGVEGR